MSGLIYTANVGNYDHGFPVEPEEGIEYWCHTEGDHVPKGWKHVRVVDLPPGDPRACARGVKVNLPRSRQEFDWFLWLDGTFEITSPVAPLIETLMATEHDFAAFKHNEWKCAYVEVQACLDRGKDTSANLSMAANLLKAFKLPRNYGQAATGVLFRKNTELVRQHAKMWWECMQETTMRDQCLFMLRMWQLQTSIHWLDGLHTKNKWFKYHRGHKR
jgi:hypothetical protein